MPKLGYFKFRNIQYIDEMVHEKSIGEIRDVVCTFKYNL